MARIRTIKPEFPQSESMGRVSRESRLCFIMLWTIADDAGRLRGNSRMLASLLFPYDDDAKKLIDRWLAELSTERCITQYEVDGDRYVQINGWAAHQKIDKPSPSKLPSPPEDSRGFARIREDSAADQGRDQGRDQGEERKGSRAKRAPDPESVPVETLVEAGFDFKTASDFIAHKAKVKAPLTQRAWADHCTESLKAGWSVQAAAEKVMARNWKGFESKYVADEHPPSRAAPVSFRQRDEQEAADKVAFLTGKKPQQQTLVEVIDVTPRTLGREDFPEAVGDIRPSLPSPI